MQPKQRDFASTQAERNRRHPRVLYIFDEPTTGLHFDDVSKLLAAFRRLIEAGGCIVVIEHNLDVIKTADWVIDLGPEGGWRGGRVVAVGTPEDIVKVPESYTGQWLAPILARNRKRSRRMSHRLQLRCAAVAWPSCQVAGLRSLSSSRHPRSGIIGWRRPRMPLAAEVEQAEAAMQKQDFDYGRGAAEEGSRGESGGLPRLVRPGLRVQRRRSGRQRRSTLTASPWLPSRTYSSRT